MIEVISKSQVSSYKLGDDFSSIEALIDDTFEKVKLVPWNKYDSFVSDVEGFRLSFNDEGNLETVVLTSIDSLKINDFSVGNITVKNLLKDLKLHGYKFIKHKDDGCYYCDDLGMNFSYKGNKVDSIEFYADSYHEQLSRHQKRAELFYLKG